MEKNLNSIVDSVRDFASENLPSLTSTRTLLAASLLTASACDGALVGRAVVSGGDDNYSYPESGSTADTASIDTDDTDTDTDQPTGSTADTGTLSNTGDTATTGTTADTGVTDPLNDSDGDLFTDSYETAQGSDPVDAGSKPDLLVTVMGNKSVLGVSDADTSPYTEFPVALDYTQTTQVLLRAGTPAKIGLEVELNKGAFALEYDETTFLGTIDVQYCGTQTGLWNPDSAACTALAGEFTETADSTTLNDWGTLDTPYDPTSFDRWFQHQEIYPGNDFEYPAVALEIQ